MRLLKRLTGGLDVAEPAGCCSCPSYCVHCDLLVGLEGLHMVDVAKTDQARLHPGVGQAS